MSKSELEQIAKFHPLRTIRGQIYDFSPVITAYVGRPDARLYRSLQEPFQSPYCVSGTVAETTTNGAWIRVDRSFSQRVFIRNLPEYLKDRDRVTVFALRDGEYPYSRNQRADVIGLDMIPCLEFGTITHSFRFYTNIFRVHQSRIEIVPVKRELMPDEIKEKTVRFQTDRALSGSPQAQFDLGTRYLKGDGVARDEKLGQLLIRKAAEQGHAQAQLATNSFQPVKR